MTSNKQLIEVVSNRNKDSDVVKLEWNEDDAGEDDDNENYYNY